VCARLISVSVCMAELVIDFDDDDVVCMAVYVRVL